MREDERERYARHLLLPGMDEAAQERLRAGRVLVVGAGGLGSPALLYLAAAGVGHLGVADADVVELSNLQRQILHSTDDLGRPKVESAAEKLRALNPDVEVIPLQVRVGTDNALDLVRDFDVVVTAVDNIETRYAINDACVGLRKTFVSASVTRFCGQTMTIAGGTTPCYRCLFPKQPPAGAVPSASVTGVFGPAAGVFGVIQASEVIKVLAGIGRPHYGRLVSIDLLHGTFDETEMERDPHCPACGDYPVVGPDADMSVC